MKIYFATDHAGFELKEQLILFVRDELGYEVEDLGAHTYDAHDDYPEIIARAARVVSERAETTRAIILGGSGQGEAMVANRFPHVRAAIVYDANTDIVRLSREHNDANVLSLGARFLSTEEAKEVVALWLEMPFSNGERHKRRIDAIDALSYN